MHGVIDGDAMMAFVRNWARLSRGLGPEAPVDHERLAPGLGFREGEREGESGPGTGAAAATVEDMTQFWKTLAPGAPNIPEWAAVAHLVIGNPATYTVCVVPFRSAALVALKTQTLGPLAATETEAFCASTDDVLTAHVWRALCAFRLQQLGLGGPDSDALMTTCARACNVRARTTPKLGPGYCGNGTTTVWTRMPALDLAARDSAAQLGDVARRLRGTLTAQGSPEAIAAEAQRQAREHTDGAKTAPRLDQHALTFVLSSW